MALNHIALPETNFLTCNLENPIGKFSIPTRFQVPLFAIPFLCVIHQPRSYQKTNSGVPLLRVPKRAPVLRMLWDLAFDFWLRRNGGIPKTFPGKAQRGEYIPDASSKQQFPISDPSPKSILRVFRFYP